MCIVTGTKVCCSGPGCSKLMTSLVNVSLKFQTLISEKCQNFLLKKFQCIRLYSRKTLNELTS